MLGDPSNSGTASLASGDQALAPQKRHVRRASGLSSGARARWQSCDALGPPETVTCTVTDSDGNVGSSSVTVVSTSPSARINHPGDGEVRDSANPVPFIGVGNDYEDGSLSGSSLVWESDLDGVFGIGTNFSTTLSPGQHVITLIVTDSDGNEGSVSISQTMQ